jgi:hypothetical protein
MEVKMGKRKVLAVIALATIGLSIASCTLVKKVLPPGQAKQLTGQQSASGKK